MISRKAQTSVEFLILTGAVLFFFIAFVFYLQTSVANKEKDNVNAVIKNIAVDVQDEINQASGVSDGYYREFVIPNDVLGRGYEIQVTANLIYVATDDGKYALSLPIANVSGNPVKGINRISKTNGMVILNP